MSNVEAWDRAAVRYQEEVGLPVDDVSYGPGLPTEAELRLLGGLAGKRVLELGCGGGQAAVALTRQGAKVIAVDGSEEQIAFARRLGEQEGVRVEWRVGDLGDLAFVPAESVDIVLSTHTLDYVEDLARVLRGVHRVLKPRGALVFSLEHPLSQGRPYFDTSSFEVERFGEQFVLHPRTFSDVVTILSRAGFRPDAMAEPAGEDAAVPGVAIWRARKAGS
jgi:ubiquinone/menaquinone biosynthesis C-methylase UbiE